MKKRILLGLMAFGSMFLSMGLAHADPTDLDMQFLGMASRDGITSSAGASDLIRGAHVVCGERMSGMTESEVISQVYAGSQLSSASSRALVLDAEYVYCPGYYGGGRSSA